MWSLGHRGDTESTVLTAKIFGCGGCSSVAHGEDAVMVLDLGRLGEDAHFIDGISKVWPSRRWGVAGEASGDSELRLRGPSRRFAGGSGDQIMSKFKRISFPRGIGRAEDRTHLNRPCSATATNEMELESKQPGGALVRNLGKMERIGRGLYRRSYGRLLWPKSSGFKPGRRSRLDAFST
jgi:hypothetical protein